MYKLGFFCIFFASSLSIDAQNTALADSIVKYQMSSGGWVKNQDWQKGADLAYINKCMKTGIGSTIDNGATTSEMKVLAKVYAETHEKRYRESFIRGLHYVLDMQYANGGWPQFYPARKDVRYASRITFNDNAMVSVMLMLRDVAENKDMYAPLHISKSLRKRAMAAFNRGVDCILKCQVRKNGRLTVWCQQHDEVTLAPASARAFELASLTGHGETVDIILLLMSIPNPSDEVKASIRGAIEWLMAHAIKDKAIERYQREDGRYDIRLVDSPNAPLLWARYYDLETEEPFFCDRDGIPRKHLEDIGYERRNGYSWLGTSPNKLRVKN